MSDQIRQEFMKHFIQCFNCGFTKECDRLSTYRVDHLQPQPGYIGKNYNGLVFLGGNPSAGWTGNHKNQAAELYRLLNGLSGSKKEKDFDIAMDFLCKIMPSWYVMDRSLSDLPSLRTNLDDIAYINVFKCPTQKNGSNIVSMVTLIN